MIFDINMTTTRRHDTEIGVRLIRKNEGKLSVLIVDKGYDDEGIREMLKRKGIKPMIRRRKFGFRDRVGNACMDEELYANRNIVEGVISSVKRR